MIYANGTESNILRRSLQRALYKDEHGRRITQESMGPLFGDTLEAGDVDSGTIYVLRSLSKRPEIIALGDTLHKLGVTSGSVEERIANAKFQPTYLMAPVEIVATWKLSGIHRFKLEETFHRLFAAAQLQVLIPDRFGNRVHHKNGFLWLPVIDEAVERIRDGSIINFAYDPAAAVLRLA